MNLSNPYTIRVYKNDAVVSVARRATPRAVERAVWAALVPTASYQATVHRVARSLGEAGREQSYHSILPQDAAAAADAVEVEYGGRVIIRFTLADLPPFVDARPEEFLAHRVSEAANAAAQLPPLPSGKRQREALEEFAAFFAEEFADQSPTPERIEELSLKLFNRVKSRLK